MVRKLFAFIFCLACTVNYTSAETPIGPWRSSEQPPDKMAVFSFVIGDDVFMLPYRNNNKAFNDAMDFIETYKWLIDDGTVVIYVNGYCGLGGTLKTRTGRVKRMSNFVKGELILRKKACEGSFITSNTTERFSDTLANAVVLKFYLPFEYAVKQPTTIAPPKNVPDMAPAHVKRSELAVANVTQVAPPQPFVPTIAATKIRGIAPRTPVARRNPLFAVKTNLLFDVASLLNLELEVPIGQRWSVAAEWVFPWWENDSYCLQLMSGTIEARYWLGERKIHNPLTGWFLGAYASGGLYDLGWKGRGVQGEYFASAGLSGGYAHTLDKRGNWRMEYSLGLGYMQTNYHKYDMQYGLDDQWHLIRQQSGVFSWVGPTRAKISLVFMIHYSNKKKEGGSR